ncbi:c-type cytochrome biogenesis protein CcmI [Aliiroseovarius sp.]|uniref:c-type cytochrome biogenesis protein CcmI n=1 Tax=Aliiroseovarius sp. TaxID=1872442 RepID=UPI00260F2401|nr:c-type cytochrome biogenesis protein CcmI [Aliiroseovarius sp.]
MSFWIFTGALALVATGAMVVALLRRREAATEGSASFDVQVYRDQLKELERDMARNTIGKAEGERARVEISRRLLEADRKAQAGSRAGEAPAGLTYVTAALVAAIVIGGGFYLYDQMGAAGYPDMGLEIRKEIARDVRENRESQEEVEATLPEWAGPPPEAPADYVALVERLREIVSTRPDELDGHMLLADHEEALGNFVAARRAQARVLEIKGAEATAGDHSRLAHLMILAAEGYVSPEAESHLARAMELDPGNETARFLTGVMYDQTGRPDFAFRMWRQLLEQPGASNSPWIGIIRDNIEGLAARAGQDYTAPPAPVGAPMAGGAGPTAEDVEAAQDMSPEEQQAMIEGMINQLSERLATEGGPVGDWARLINVLGVVGNTERAKRVFEEGLGVFAGNEEAIALLTDAARSAGVSE